MRMHRVYGSGRSHFGEVYTALNLLSDIKKATYIYSPRKDKIIPISYYNDFLILNVKVEFKDSDIFHIFTFEKNRYEKLKCV